MKVKLVLKDGYLVACDPKDYDEIYYTSICFRNYYCENPITAVSVSFIKLLLDNGCEIVGYDF